jgi:hypothetical protein
LGSSLGLKPGYGEGLHWGQSEAQKEAAGRLEVSKVPYLWRRAADIGSDLGSRGHAALLSSERPLDERNVIERVAQYVAVLEEYPGQQEIHEQVGVLQPACMLQYD